MSNKKTFQSRVLSQNGKGQRTDPEFLWSLTCDESLSEWQANFKNFLELQHRSYNLYKQAINHFLDYLLYYPIIPRIIKKYVSVNYTIKDTFYNYLLNIKQLDEKSQG